jgi:hypothetical protein
MYNLIPNFDKSFLILFATSINSSESIVLSFKLTISFVLFFLFFHKDKPSLSKRVKLFLINCFFIFSTPTSLLSFVSVGVKLKIGELATSA